ncbi:MAG: Class I peptide chain release factor [Candidatus Nomurabacteria bacterium GW2011_GWA2_40_9]|uniref:Class I peptide chain release factor n=1 Tax=Candidatus Nomurabacteria bacterium GW2011_GWA2_40_9 TaxID=1618734 RepID=A0A0G0TQY5_9BACT|nr:MAG: Class I peptide chain release factor [Candidatus Nomurabacteria bacterium GW2011_GWA2_40_9]
MQIPESEFIITFARSSGKGGQNVNKTSTKVILHWPVGKSLVLSDEEKARVREKLVNKINNEDELVLMSEEERSQPQNKEIAIARLQSLVTEALRVPKKRRSTRPTKASKLRRIESKKQRSEIKVARRTIE